MSTMGLTSQDTSLMQSLSSLLSGGHKENRKKCKSKNETSVHCRVFSLV